MSAIRVGSYVTHSQRPAWGLGKVFGQSQQHVLVGFSALPEAERFKRLELRPGLLDRAEVRQDPELDSWNVECDSTCHYIGAVEKPRRSKAATMTREQAMEKFLGKFGGGFPDAWYRSTHRDPRLAQHQAFTARLSPERLRVLANTDPRAAADALLGVIESSLRPLLAKTELARLHEALTWTNRLPAFLNALADLLEAEQPSAATFDPYLAAFEALAGADKRTPLTWPIVTVIPYLAQPDRHMFVKPVPICAAASRLGVALRFNRKPNWGTYERVLAFSHHLLEFTAPRGGEDMIDVHAFIAATAE